MWLLRFIFVLPRAVSVVRTHAQEGSQPQRQHPVALKELSPLFHTKLVIAVYI